MTRWLGRWYRRVMADTPTDRAPSPNAERLRQAMGWEKLPEMTDEQYERWYMAECCRCGRRRHKAGSWPDGYVCRTCSDRAVRRRGICPGCGQDRALPGCRPADGIAICATCARASDTFAWLTAS